MDTATQVQILDTSISILRGTNNLEKGMNPTNLTSAMSKIVGQSGLFSFGMATDLGEGKVWIQTC